MNIDFPPPSKGTYNNAGSSRKLCNYCEHEDMERMAAMQQEQERLMKEREKRGQKKY